MISADPFIGDVNRPQAQYTDIAGLPVRERKPFAYFHEVIDEDKAASLAAGRPIARSRVFLCIPTPGDPNTVIDRPAKDKDKLEYPEQWRAFQEKREQVVEGTPIEMWPLISRTQAYELKAMHIHTVEQFINLPETAAHRVMMFQEMRRKAIAWLQAAKDSGLVESQAKEINDLKAELAALRALIEAKPKRGRPKKVQAE